jgi:hypothetical protein
LLILNNIKKKIYKKQRKMIDKNIIKNNDKYTLVRYTDELTKVNKDFIKQNGKFIDNSKLKRMKQGFLGYED